MNELKLYICNYVQKIRTVAAILCCYFSYTGKIDNNFLV